MNPSQKLAQRLALGVPALLLAGAYLSQYGFGLYPCEMCWWQRYPHFAAVGLALLSTLIPPRTLWIGLAGLAVFVSGLIGGFHAGVEYGWWQGLTTCSGPLGAGGGDPLDAIMNAPLVRCDVPAWTLGGISLAGFNALISVVSAIAIFVLLVKGRRA
ncbi:disulfide bond formation protein B [Croceibacterium sp. LX-88]|uniref:Disulfide bond formation protein B n=1 Tax=Croceibacterium selenioxidans TaxID=2838833 RepID=A0ABS5W653_9SPHN|nr:disulfide bond formation protein B [Croceibacterium selenioxidans]MBT2135220.1 disulfide bond formation protein B [Croceibacterium selenioxidans]